MYSRYFSLQIEPNSSWAMISEKPMIALIGVRNSWLMLARKSLFERFAISAWLRAWINIRSDDLTSVTSE